MLCVSVALCWIEAQAFGANGDNKKRYGYVKLDGVAVWQASWRGEYPGSRGANMFTIEGFRVKSEYFKLLSSWSRSRFRVLRIAFCV